MIKQLLEEVRSAPLDEAGRARLNGDPPRLDRRARARPGPRAGRGAGTHLAAVHRRQHPTDAELRIAQAQLVGWLEGLFHGIQTALFAQQMAARAQLEQMRALPAGHPAHPDHAGRPGAPGTHPGPADGGPTGQYL